MPFEAALTFVVDLVGLDHGVQLRSLGQDLQSAVEALRQIPVVRIEESQQRRPRLRDRQVAAGRNAAIAAIGVTQHAQALAMALLTGGQQCRGAIAAAVIDHQQFQRRGFDGHYRLDGLVQTPGAVVGGHDDADLRRKLHRMRIYSSLCISTKIPVNRQRLLKAYPA